MRRPGKNAVPDSLSRVSYHFFEDVNSIAHGLTQSPAKEAAPSARGIQLMEVHGARQIPSPPTETMPPSHDLLTMPEAESQNNASQDVALTDSFPSLLTPAPGWQSVDIQEYDSSSSSVNGENDTELPSVSLLVRIKNASSFPPSQYDTALGTGGRSSDGSDSDLDMIPTPVEAADSIATAAASEQSSVSSGRRSLQQPSPAGSHQRRAPSLSHHARLNPRPSPDPAHGLDPAANASAEPTSTASPPSITPVSVSKEQLNADRTAGGRASPAHVWRKSSVGGPWAKREATPPPHRESGHDNPSAWPQPTEVDGSESQQRYPAEAVNEVLTGIVSNSSSDGSPFTFSAVSSSLQETAGTVQIPVELTGRLKGRFDSEVSEKTTGDTAVEKAVTLSEKESVEVSSDASTNASMDSVTPQQQWQENTEKDEEEMLKSSEFQNEEEGGHEQSTATVSPEAEAEAARQQTRVSIARLTEDAFVTDAKFMQRNLAALNSEAAVLQKSGELVMAVVAYAKLFKRAAALRLSHPELYTCYGNRAAAYLKLGLYDEALMDAERCRQMAQESFKKSGEAIPQYVKSFVKKGGALMGLGRYREAVLAFEEGLQADPFCWELKKGLQEASDGVMKDLLSGKGREVLALQAPVPDQRITYHPYSAPLHRIKNENMLPVQLLTPFQADNDHHVKDTYNYVTVQTDIRMPRRHFGVLADTARQAPWQAAIQAAVLRIEGEDKDCRVLNLGAGAGLHAMTALKAGARHVTAVERWLYLSSAAQEALIANGFSPETFSVVYKRPTDLALIRDVPIVCNLLICDIMDEGLLSSGLIPAVSHALHSLMTSDAIVLPASATVFVQAADIRTKETCGVNLSPVDRHRWHPAYLAGAPLADGMYTPLTEPIEAWHFDMLSPPESSAQKTIDLTFTAGGHFNSLVFWFELQLIDGITLSTSPQAVAAGLKTLGPAVQYLPGEMLVESGQVLPLLATHNTVRMRFDVEAAEYLNLARTDSSFPPVQFAMLADDARNQAYERAIGRAVATCKKQDGEAHAIDIGTGIGLLSVLTARAGADSVVACDLHEPLANLARRVVAVNGCADTVSVVCRDAGLLERGHQVRRRGANLAIADFFDAGLLGDSFQTLLELAKRNVLMPGATVVPQAATLYCAAIEVLPTAAGGFDFATFDKFRWAKDYEAVDLADIPHRMLTAPCRVFEYFFEGVRRGRGRENILKMPITTSGTVTSIAFWFDLHLDDVESITTAPFGIGLGGAFEDAPAEDSPQESSSTHTAVSAEILDTDISEGAADAGAIPNDQVIATSIVAAAVAEEAVADESADSTPGTLLSSLSAKQGVNESVESSTNDEPCLVLSAEPSAIPSKTPPHQASEPQIEIAASGTAGSCSVTEEWDDEDGGFSPAVGFMGQRPGFAFMLGDLGLGYYPDSASAPPKRLATALNPDNDCASASEGLSDQFVDSASATAAPSIDSSDSTLTSSPELNPSASPTPKAVIEAVIASTTAVPNAANINQGEKTSAKSGEARNPSQEATQQLPAGNSSSYTATERLNPPIKPRVPMKHYWGQALQYLDRSVAVVAGKKLTLLAKRDGNRVRFSLREGVGEYVEKPPWLVEWGGGSSIENPHVQRVHYTELLVRDFLQRVKCKRFPSIEKDMKMVLAHCGSLFLDTAALCQIYHELVVLEKIHERPEFCPGASLEAITKPPIRLY